MKSNQKYHRCSWEFGFYLDCLWMDPEFIKTDSGMEVQAQPWLAAQFLAVIKINIPIINSIARPYPPLPLGKIHVVYKI